MNAVLSPRYGSPDILEIRQVPKPEPAAGEILVRVHATTVTRTDCGLLRARPLILRFLYPLVGVGGFFRPKFTTLGMDFAGVVESVGPGVSTFAPGDRVFGLSPRTFGAHAEYLCMPEQVVREGRGARGAIGHIPAGRSFDEAVVCEGAWYALISLQALGLKPGQRILIYGASGAIGTAAVQLAKSMGATVTAVVATRHLELAKSLGADHVIDYAAPPQDFTRSAISSTGELFDCVFDAVGKTTYFRCRRLLKPQGVFCAADIGPWGANALPLLWSLITKSKRIGMAIPRNAKASFDYIQSRMEAKEFRAVIDRTYPLDKIADAYRYVETGQKTGIVVIHVRPADAPARP